MTNKKRKEEEEASAPILKKKGLSVEVEMPEGKGKGIKCLVSRSDPLALFLLLVVLAVLSVATYYEFAIEETGEKVQKQLSKVLSERRHSGKQLSKILSRIEQPMIHGMPVEQAVKVSEACDQTHCSLPCVRGRSQGFGNFLKKALDVAEPIISNIPFLPKAVTQVVGPVSSLVRKITGHPYSSISNEYCARILDMGSGPDMGGALRTGPSGMKALEYLPADYRGRSHREKREIEGETEEETPGFIDTEAPPPGEGYAEYLAEMYKVEVESDDEDEALDNVLTAIFGRLEL